MTPAATGRRTRRQSEGLKSPGERPNGLAFVSSFSFAFSLFFGAHLCKLRSLGDDEIVGWAENEEKKMSNRAVPMACKEQRR